MLVLLLSTALADYDGGYSYGDSGYSCYISGYNCTDCERCNDVDCEMAAEAAGKELECRVGGTKDGFSVWCDCGGGGDTDTDVDADSDVDTDTDTDTTGDDTGGGEDKADSSCGCDASASPVTVFGALALLSGGLLMRRRRG